MGDHSVPDFKGRLGLSTGVGGKHHGLHLWAAMVWPCLPWGHPASGAGLAAGGAGSLSHHPTPGCESVRTQHKSGRYLSGDQRKLCPAEGLGDQPSLCLTFCPHRPPCQPQETRPFASAQAHLCHPQSVTHSILHVAQCFSKCGQHHQLHLGTCSKCKFLDPTPDLLSQKLWSGTQHKPSRC